MQETLYNRIGTGYNATRQADPFLASRLFHFLKPGTGKVYIDIGCGTGNYTIAMLQKGLNFYGIDPSEKMLSIAQSLNNNINWLMGASDKIPVSDHVFDGAIATLTIHHWEHLERSLKEISRVLKEEARIVFFTSTPEQMKEYWLNHYFPKMLAASMLQMPSLHKISEALSGTGFGITTTEKYFIDNNLKDHFLYAGKNRPHLYLDPLIRNGMSSFTNLANAEEVEKGLLQLESDISQDKFRDIQNRYRNDTGDYLFIVADKK